jgi:NADH-ubiquinone oxidoreductase chain 2
VLTISILIFIIALAINYHQVTQSFFFLRIGLLIFALTGALSFNALYIQSIGSGMGIYSGLFQVTVITQFIDLFISVMGAFILLIWPLNSVYYIRTETKPVLTNTSAFLYFKELFSKISNLDSVNSMFKAINVISIQNYPREYSLITLLSTLGASLLISSSDLISLYLSIELQSFGVYLLASIYRNSEAAVSASLKYFLLGSLASCIILLGCSIIYTYTGLTHFDSIYSFITVTDNSGIIQGISLGIVLIFIGFFFKIGAAPLHNWSPDVYDNSPSIVTIWLTIMPKISLLILLLELYINIGLIEYNYSLFSVSGIEQNTVIYFIKNLILISSIISLIIGSTVGLSQIKIKRLLAYSTISHLGFILLALAINTEQSIESLLFYIIQYSLTNFNIFLILIALGIFIHSIIYDDKQNSNKVEYKGTENDIQYIKELKGIFFENPILSLSLSICLFSMAGIPPLIGFFSKQFVLYAAIQKGFYFISIVAIIVSVISASYYLNIIKNLHVSDIDSKFNLAETKTYITTSTSFSIYEKKGLVTGISSIHSFIISTLTISILLFILKPSLLLNSTSLLSLTIFYY